MWVFLEGLLHAVAEHLVLLKPCENEAISLFRLRH